MRQLSLLDHVLGHADQALRTSFARGLSQQPNPAGDTEQATLSDQERKHAAGLMRINHVGEVCAQALYLGQAATARDGDIRQHMLHAADEEADHLAWCHDRLDELDSRPSLLNPLWFAGSFAIGAAAGLSGDRWSLGFVMETERQVEAHLEDHLERLPEPDQRSRAIVRRMAEDEARHGNEAKQAGGRELPQIIRRAMQRTADVMKMLAYRI